MALADVTISFDLNQILGADFDGPVRAVVVTNVASGTLIDTSTNEIRMGSQEVTVASDGTGSWTTWAPGVDGNPTSWQETLVVSYRDAQTRQRATRRFGPFTLSTSANLADLVEEQEVPAEYLTTVTELLDTYVTEAEAARDAAVDISNISTSDEVVEALIEGTGGAGPLTRAALSASYVAPKAKTTPGAAASLTYFNVKDYGAVGDGITDDTVAIQAAIDAARGGTQLGTVMLPTGTYAISATLNVGTTTTNPVRILGAGGKGSLFAASQPVRIIRTTAGATFTMLQATGRGLHLEGLNFDGQYGVGTILAINQGFELVIHNCRFYRSGGAGMTLRALSNASLMNVHVDNCGSTTVPAVTFGAHATYGLSNTVLVTNMHIERSPGIDLDLAATDTVNDSIEYLFFRGLHIEGAIDNSNLVAYKTYPLVKVGRVKNVTIDSSYLYTGAEAAIVVDYNNTASTTGQGMLTVSNTTLFGQPGVGIPTARPARLVDLVNGNGVVLVGNSLKFATSEYVRIQSTFGSDVLWTANRFDKTITSPFSTASITDVLDSRTAALADPGMAGPLKAARLATHGSPPTVAANAANGTSPATPTISGVSNDGRGIGYFGSGTSPAAGNQLRVTFKRPFAVAPIVQVTPGNSATAALDLFVASTTTYFDVYTRIAPAASQANGTYQFQWITMG